MGRTQAEELTWLVFKKRVLEQSELSPHPPNYGFYPAFEHPGSILAASKLRATCVTSVVQPAPGSRCFYLEYRDIHVEPCGGRLLAAEGTLMRRADLKLPNRWRRPFARKKRDAR
jgi:hypothetical protein